MAWYNCLIVIIPSSAAAVVLGAANELPLQITALGVLAFSVAALWRYLNKMTDTFHRERTTHLRLLRQTVDLYRANININKLLAEMLKDRPCILNDGRLKKLGVIKVSDVKDVDGDEDKED